jgi:hypothetical protein
MFFQNAMLKSSKRMSLEALRLKLLLDGIHGYEVMTVADGNVVFP